MGIVRLLRVETFRMLNTRLTWLFITLIVASPAFGLTMLQINPAQTTATQMIINPIMIGTVGAAALFAIFTLMELDRVYKYNVNLLTDAVASPITLHAARVGALIAASLVTVLLVLVVYLPFTMHGMGEFFDIGLYVQSYMIFMLPAMWISSLFAAVFYQLFRRIDVAAMAVLGCIFLSFIPPFFDHFILRWFLPNLPVFSDAFGNDKPLRVGLYMRQFWILLLGGAWLISLTFTRRYGRGLVGSFICNVRKFYIPAMGVVLILLSVNHFRTQPFFNSAGIEVDWDKLNNLGQNMNVTEVRADVTPNVRRNRLYGRVVYTINGNSYAGSRRMNINSGYQIHSMTLDGESIAFTDLCNDMFVARQIEFALPVRDGKMELVVEYGGMPMMWGFTHSVFSGADISRRNIELLNYSVIPFIGAHGADINVNVVLPDNFTLLMMRGDITHTVDNHDGTKTWSITDTNDNIGFFASEYVRRVVAADEITVTLYHHAAFTRLLEANYIDQVLAEVFNFCTARFGPLHYIGDGELRLVQSSAFMMGGFAGDGQSVMGETAFSIYSLTDPWKGASGMEILAHEIIHQWWGLNRMFWPENEDPEWSAEGLTVYTTYRLFKEKHGEEFARINYVDVWQSAVDSMNRNFFRRNPEYLDIMPEAFQARLRVHERQVLMYSLMPLKIRRAEQIVGCTETFDAILYKLSNTNNFMPLTYQEFLDAVGLTREDLRLG